MKQTPCIVILASGVIKQALLLLERGDFYYQKPWEKLYQKQINEKCSSRGLFDHYMHIKSNNTDVYRHTVTFALYVKSIQGNKIKVTTLKQ